MIESLLYQHLCNCEDLTSLLATYDERPAIFHQIAPFDTDEKWKGKMQFSRIVYDIDKTGDVERKISGNLYIDIMCSQGSIEPEAIETVLKDIIDGYFFEDDDGMTYSAQWERSDGFTVEKNNQVFGLTLSFSLLAFPLQNTGTFDTIGLMNTWSKTTFPQATIINISATQKVFKPTDENPAIYWSSQGLTDSPVESIYHCTWVQSNLTMHIIAPSTAVRNSLVQQAHSILSFKSRIMSEDGTQFMLHRAVANMTADPFRVGQLIVQGSYPLIRPENDVSKLRNITNTLR